MTGFLLENRVGNMALLLEIYGTYVWTEATRPKGGIWVLPDENCASLNPIVARNSTPSTKDQIRPWLGIH